MIVRSSHVEGRCKVVLMKDLTKLIGKLLHLSFNAVAGCKFIDKETLAQVKPADFTKIYRIAFL